MRAALSFLTRIPVRQVSEDDYFQRLGREALLFPVVGLIVGAVLLMVDGLSSLFFGLLVRTILVIATGVWITGALHLDGLMDTADGVGSHRSRQRMLEVMRDSRVGAMGAIAGSLSLLMRMALLTELTGALRWQAILLAPVIGRMTLVLSAGLFPPVQTGLGASFSAHVDRKQIAGALGVCFFLALVLGATRGLAATSLALCCGLLVSRTLVRSLGGLTGDTYGAANEVAELVVCAVFAATWQGFHPW